jgi:hypothetical protein
MKPGLYKLGFAPGFSFIIRVKEAKPNEAKICGVEGGSDTVREKFLHQVIFVDSIWIGHPPVFKSTGAKPVTLIHEVESKALMSASYGT